MRQTQTMYLKYPKDYTDWEKLIQQCKTINGLTKIEKEKAKRAFGLLREEFGQCFLKNTKHPLMGYIKNLVPWTRKWIIRFAESIQDLKRQDNYQTLHKRLKDNKKFNEGLSVLDVAYKLFKAGFDIIIDSPVDISGTEKIPDLKLIDRDTSEELFVEVSELKQGKSAEEAFETSRKVFETLWGSIPFIWYCGHIYKTLSQKHLDYVVNKVKETIERAKKENSFQELVEDAIEIGIAPENDIQVLKKWASERELEVGEFYGPPFDVDEILRIKRKIYQEQKQLPHDYPNILVIWNTNLFLRVHDMAKVISQLEEFVYDYPHLMAVVIVGEHGGGGEDQVLMKDQNIYIKKQRYDLLLEHCIILLNQSCKIKVSPSIIAKMYCGFGKY